MFDQLRRTFSDKLGGILRILLGFVFFMAGILKIVVPSLGEAFSGQLIAAGIPLREIVIFTFPIVEMVLGVFLLLGFHARLSAAAAALSMAVATYVHIAIEDPSLFPLRYGHMWQQAKSPKKTCRHSNRLTDGSVPRCNVLFGSLAACQHHISPTAAFERIAVIRQ